MVTEKNNNIIAIIVLAGIGTAYVILTILYYLTAYAPTFGTYDKQYEYAKGEYTDAMTIPYILPGAAKWKWIRTFKAVKKLEKLYPEKAHKDPAILGALERSCYMLGRYEESLNYLNDGARLFMKEYFVKDGNKDYAGAIFFYNSRARCYLGLHQYDKAIAEYQKIIDNYSNIPETTTKKYSLLGDTYRDIIKIYEKLHQHNKAIEWCEKWEKNLKDPLQLTFARDYRAKIHLELGQIDKAKELYESIIFLYGDTKDNWVTGTAKRELDRLTKRGKNR